MNKAELIEALAVRLGDRRTATQALDAVLAEIQMAVTKGDRVAITGFGAFEKRVRGPRTARNPRTGEAVKVKKTAVPAFKPGAGFKEMVAAGKVPKVAGKKTAKTAKAAGVKATKTTAKAAPVKAAKTTAAKTTAAKATKTTAKAAPVKVAAKKTTAKAVKTTKATSAAKSTARATATAKATKSAPAKTAKKAAAKKR